jgi:ATP-dependent helicase/nuclease subunit A
MTSFHPIFHPIVRQKPPSAEQTPAVMTTDRDVVLVAGAGAGKTRTLVARILHLLAQGAPPRGILAVTFTVKAAREMRNRLRQEITAYLAQPGLDAAERTRWQAIYADLDAARIGTIHGLCSEILHAHPAEAAIDPDFAVLEEATMLQLRAEAVAEALAWATDDAAATLLFAHFTADKLAALLDALLADRLNADALCAGRCWEGWPAIACEALGKALADETLTAAAAEIMGLEASGSLAAALAANDPLAPALADFPEAWRTVQHGLATGDPALVITALPRLRAAVPGNCGRAANWPRVAIKTLTKEVRDAYDAQIKPLVEGVDPALDAQLATLMPQIERLFRQALARYHSRKEERHALDFDDLEARTLDLLRTNAEVCARWQQEAHALLVDEFQDTNGRQRDLVRLLNAGRGRLLIVGDAKQSIYRFRGADVEVFRQERAAIEQHGLRCDMQRSYRSHAALLDALNPLLAGVMGDTPDANEPWREPFAALHAVRPTQPDALPPPFIEFHLATGAKGAGSLDRAADGLAMRLRELVSAPGAPPAWEQVAVLCRTARGFAAYEDAFERARIPYETVAGRGFLDRPEVRDLLNALQAVTDPTDDLALYGLLRSPAIGLPDTRLHHLCLPADATSGDATSGDAAPGALWRALGSAPDAACRNAAALIEELNRLAGRIPVADLLKHFVDRTGYRAILLAAGDGRGARNVSKLLLDAQRSAVVSTGAFLEAVRGLRKRGTREGEARADSHGAVQIMSVHQAKGLEFPIVVIGDAAVSAGGHAGAVLLDPELGVVVNYGGERGAPVVWKLAQQRAARKEAAESDRLLYVAATRAQDRLLFSGHIRSVKKNGDLSIDGWLGQLCTGAGLVRLPEGCDMEGDGVWPLHLTLARAAPGTAAIGGALYAAHYRAGGRADAPAAAAPLPSAATPRLLDLLPPSPAATIDATPPRVWRVAPRQAQRWAPGWVVGKLVHDALMAWRFPADPQFAAWRRAQARGYGLLDAARLDNAMRRTRQLLDNLRRHPLCAEIEAADVRRHELPYVLPGATPADAATFGQIDLLFCRDGRWTLVDFKSDRLRDERARRQLLEESDYPAQVERYLAAVTAWLGVRPRGLLCLLDDRGACSVVEVGGEAALHAPVTPVDDEAAWVAVHDLADPVCAALLHACRANGLPTPEVGYDITGRRERVVATAELAWPDQQIALFLPGQESDLLQAGAQGWRTLLAEAPLQAAEHLLALWHTPQEAPR